MNLLYLNVLWIVLFIVVIIILFGLKLFDWIYITFATLFYGPRAGLEAYAAMQRIRNEYNNTPDSVRPDSVRPDPARPDPSLRPDTLIPDSVRPDPVRPEPPLRPDALRPQNARMKTIAFLVFNFTAMIFFFLCAFYSPWRIGILKAGDDAKKKYEATKKESDMYQEQVKSFWIDALNKENRYFFITFMLLSLLPFFCFLFFICTNEVPQIETFLNQTFSFLLLLITVFYTAMVLLVYTICHEKIYMIIPFLLFFFLGGMMYFQRPIPFMTTVGFLGLCLIEAVLVLKRVAFAWCLIPLVPFFLTLFILYAQ